MAKIKIVSAVKRITGNSTMKFSRSYLGLLGLMLAGWPTAFALQWTTVEAVLRPMADGTMPVASYPF
jgi:hypothetical protein